MKPENKYIKDEKTSRIFKSEIDQTILALDTKELFEQENFDRLFEYCMRDIYDLSSQAIICLVIGAAYNEKSIKMIKDLFLQTPTRKHLELLKGIKKVCDELISFGDYPFVKYEYFEVIAQEINLLSKQNKNQPTL